MKNFRENRGITLIALIITIIVLLIIASISISGGIDGIDKANDNRAMSDLEKVQHAITERYTKVKLTKDTSVIVGTKVDTLPTLPTPEGGAEAPTWKVFQGGTDENLTPLPEREYYRLSKSDLEDLGLTGDYKNSSYIVNYYSGEVFDETAQTTSEGKILYKSATDSEASAFGDDYVKSGMKVWYDAINNTGSGHSNSTTTWKDLSGNDRDGTMTDVTWNGNYAEFDGTSSWIDMGDINSDYMTMEIICCPARLHTSDDQFQTILANYGDTAGGGIGIDYDGKVTGEYVINNSYKTIRSDKIKKDEAVFITLSYDGNTEKVYINGEANPSKNIIVNGTIKSPNYNMVLGKAPAGGHFFQGKIYSTRVYNKALSADEVKHNYILDKNRFGIEE